MANPFAIATQGKGVFPMLGRMLSIIRRYGLSAAQMDKNLSQLAATLQAYNCQATLPTTSMALARNQSLASRVHTQGIELAVHGLVHVDHSQLSLEQQVDHLTRARQIFDQAGIPVSGFRCPYLRWSRDTLTALSQCGFDYDSSQALDWNLDEDLENEAYAHVLQFYGAESARQYPSLPWMEGNLVRIPYCLPDDEALVERLKISPGPAMSEVWLSMLGSIYEAGELFTLGLHPERTGLCKDALAAVLAQARSLNPPVWIARLDEIAAWYRAMGQIGFEVRPLEDGCMQLTVQAPDRARLLARAVELNGTSTPWDRGFNCVPGNQMIFRSDIKPWIGLPPGHPALLSTFLRHLGYLVEINDNPFAFSYYFHPKTFLPEDERALLGELQAEERPLIRVGRWPDGARAAMSITGDVDAFTLWDYFGRVLSR